MSPLGRAILTMCSNNGVINILQVQEEMPLMDRWRIVDYAIRLGLATAN